ncbi:autotransporter outer membrane beta-barrel domain-containing protein [Candidatus Parcubacteria bacterium]|nr:MAG: autotransporter outer membrane beta-barrel domain-containing protein [Candidatus Parcubacteria bacterium]
MEGNQVFFSFTIPDPPPQTLFTGTIVIFELGNQELVRAPESVQVPVTIQVIAEPVILDVPSRLSGLPGETVSGTITVIQGDPPFSLTVSAGQLSRSTGVGLQEPVTFTYTIPPDATPGQSITILVTASSVLDQIGEATITVDVLQQKAQPVVIEVPRQLEGAPGETVSGTIRVVEGDAPFSLSVDRGKLSKSSNVGLNEPVTYRFTIPTDAKLGERFPVTVTATSRLGESGMADFDIVVSQSAVDLLGSLAKTPPQREMGRVIGVVCPKQVAGGNLQRDCDALIQAAAQQDPSAGEALAQVTPDQVSAPIDASQTAMQIQMRNIGARLAALRAGAQGIALSGLSFSLNGQPIQLAALGSGWMNAADTKGSPLGTLAGGRLGVFVNGDVRLGSRDRTDLTEGFEFDTYGVTLGADYRFQDTFVAGTSIGYANNSIDIDEGRGELDSDGWSGSLYATWYKDFDARNGIYVDGLTTYGTLEYDQIRAIRYRLQTGTQVNQELSGDFDGSQWAFSFGGGYRWQQGALSVGPVLYLDYISASVDGYNETARDPSAPGSGWRIHISDQDIESLTTKLGLDLNYAMNKSWGVLVPQLKLDWVHEFKLDADSITGYFIEDPTREAFQLEVDRPDRDYLYFGIGAVMQLTRGLSGHVFYRKLLGHDTLNMDSISLGLRMEF